MACNIKRINVPVASKANPAPYLSTLEMIVTLIIRCYANILVYFFFTSPTYIMYSAIESSPSNDHWQ